MKEKRDFNADILAKNLKHYMYASGKNQKEMAEIAGVTPTTFCRYLKGIYYPRIDTIQKIADYFGIPKSYLTEEKNEVLNVDRADFHARILRDKDTLALIEAYYELSDVDKRAVRLMTYALRDKKAT